MVDIEYSYKMIFSECIREKTFENHICYKNKNVDCNACLQLTMQNCNKNNK